MGPERGERPFDEVVESLTGIGPTLNDMTAPLYGADDHLDKPFEFDDLASKVKDLLKG